MTIDVYSSTGQKTGTKELPVELFGARINQGLIHQAVVRQQSNRRLAVAHAKNRSEVEGSSRKLYAQKHTGRARRGSVRSPLLRGGGKAFGPRNVRNFEKDMPKAMRHAALRACLSLKAKEQAIVGLESYPETVKTKDAASLLKKISLELGRRILIVVPATHRSLMLSIRNIPNVKTLVASYLNPEDVIAARHLVFMDGAIEKAQEVFGKRERVRVAGKRSVAVAEVQAEETPKKAAKKPAAKKAAPKKKSSPKAS